MNNTPSVSWDQLCFWTVVTVFLGCIIYIIRSILPPFIIGAVVAYILSPMITKLEQFNIHRQLGTLLILTPCIGGLLVILFLLIPALQKQIVFLIQDASQNIQSIQNFIMHFFGTHVPQDLLPQVKKGSSEYTLTIIEWMGEFLKNMLASGLVIANMLSVIFIMPLVAFYTLRDWPKMVDTVYGLFPKEGQPIVRIICSAMNTKLSGFIRGQLIVCTLLALYYATILSLASIKFSIAIGLITGFFSFIPYAGVLTGLCLSLLVSALNFTDWAPFFYILIIFGVGQILDGFFLAPKFVGNRIGLHPLWIIFSLFVGGLVLGFIGLLIAIPVAACLSVIIALSLKRYKNSSYYAPAPHPPKKCQRNNT